MAEEIQKEKKQKDQKKGKPLTKERKTGAVVRIHSSDIDGSKNLLIGLSRIKGVGYTLSNAIIYKLGLDKKRKLIELTESEIETIENAISNPASLGIPSWMFNRQKDLDSGNSMHIHTADLIFSVKSDKDLMGEIKSYKGLRHARGLKVRGQRTASTGRGRVAVGVLKKKTQAAAVAAAKSDDKKK